MTKALPFLYITGNSPLHSFQPMAKFLCLIILSAGAMAAGGLGAIVLVLLCVLALICLRLGPVKLFAKARFLLPMALMIFLFRCFQFDLSKPFLPDELLPALTYLMRLILVFTLSEVFFSSTKLQELGAALSIASRFLFRREQLDPGLYLSLAVGFIPQVFKSYQRAMEAAQVRGFSAHRQSMRHIRVLLTHFVRSVLASALTSAEALEARNYRPDRALKSPPWTIADTLLVAGALLSFAICIFAP